MAGQAFLLVAPFIRPDGGKGDTSLPYYLYAIVGIAVLVLSVFAWLVWWVIMPKVGGFEWKKRKVQIDHGTMVTQFYPEKKFN